MIKTTAKTAPLNLRFKITGVALFALLFAGCASTGPTPAEVCSAEWIKPRTDAALSDFTRSTKGPLQKLQKAGESMANKGSLGLIERASVLLSLSKLMNQFQDSQALSDLQTLGTTCNDPELVRNALVGTLQEYDVPEPLINLMGELEQFMELMGESGLTQ